MNKTRVRFRRREPARSAKEFVLSFPPGTNLVEVSPGNLEIKTPNVKQRVTGIGPGVLAAMYRMREDGACEKELADIVQEIDGAEELPRFYFYLIQFSEQGMLCRSIYWNDKPLATSVPISSRYRFESLRPSQQVRYVLSRFAYCRRAGQRLVVESPLSYGQLILHSGEGASILAELAQPCRYADLCSRVPEFSHETVLLFLELLLNTSLLTKIEGNREAGEDLNDSLRQWEFHDLLFHSRSRAGRHSNPYGRTNRFVGKLPQPSAIRPKHKGQEIMLHKPDLERLVRQDSSFTRVLEERCSSREHGEPPITDRELGEFLYRSARVRETFTVDGYEIAHRVYPGGGAAYELELYLAVDRCTGLSPGLYHYCALNHRLYRLSRRVKTVDSLLESAARTARAGKPQVAIIIAARFKRMTWRYESMAYAAILKDVGVLFQTMYLVATAMGLSSCALGGGGSDLFAEAVGVDYYDESSVGEFILGR